MRKWLIGIGAVLLLAIASCLIYIGFWFKPMLRERLIAAVREQYHREVEIKDLSISLIPNFSAVGEEFVLHQKERPGLPPLATIKRLTVNATLKGVMSEPVRIDRMTLEGLQIKVPPKRPDAEKTGDVKREPPRFVINEVIADGAVLQILSKTAGKGPLTFDIFKLTLNSAGTIEPMNFRATLSNPTPPGRIQSAGKFGPWVNDEPSLTPVSGNYSFQNADLSVFKGVAGILSSEGKYQGVLGRIEVDGATDTPDFTVKTGGNPVHLKTQFHAIVDGTDGDTYLEPIKAQFGRSSLVARGGIYGQPGMTGKTVSLDVTVSNSRIEDLLRLAVKGDAPLMVGGVDFKTKFELPPGDRDVMEKLRLEGEFGVGAARFTSFSVQEKVDELSNRARGQLGEQATDERVVSDLRGNFVLNNGVIRFSSLNFNAPGAAVELQGSYALHGERLDFYGTLRTQAKVSQMTTGVKSLFLRLIDPLFKQGDAGAVVPITITGTREQPNFNLDVKQVFTRKF